MSEPSPPDDDKTVMAPVGRLAPEPERSPIGGQNALPPGTRLEEFELERPVGEGGFSIVYLAHDHSLQRKVAIKEYLPCALATRRSDLTVTVVAERYAETFKAGLASFIKEANTLAHFDHPSLVKVFRFWRANGTAYMAMPFYDGPTLKDALRQLGHPPDESWLRSILGPVMDALEVLHAENYLHRDVAPDNILLLPGNRPVLLDFGAARRAITDMTQSITVILKPGYAPIEQYAEASSLQQGPWTDCYALASVVYFAIMGKRPAPAVERIVSDPLVPLARGATGRYGEQFLRALDAAMAVKPENRPQSIAEFRKLLGVSSTSTTERLPYRDAPDEKSRGRLWKVLGIGVVLLVIAGVTAVLGPKYISIVQHEQKEKPPVTTPATTPATTATSAPAAPQVAKQFEPMAVMDVLYDGRDPSRVVIASTDRAQVAIDKDFVVTVESPASGYLYLFILDSQSRFVLAFPNKQQPNNVVKPSVKSTHTFAQSGPAGGVDNYVAIVTQEPHQFGPPRWREYDKDFLELPLQSAAALYGTKDWSASQFLGDPRCPNATADCSKPYGAARFTVEAIEPARPPGK